MGMLSPVSKTCLEQLNPGQNLVGYTQLWVSSVVPDRLPGVFQHTILFIIYSILCNASERSDSGSSTGKDFARSLM